MVSKSAKKVEKKPVRIKLSDDPKRKLEGYGLTDPSATTRRVALLSTVEKGAKKTHDIRASMLTVQRRVQVLSIFFKRSNPVYAARAKSNAKYLSNMRKLFAAKK